MSKAIKTIADLELDPRNPRKRGMRAEALLVQSLQEVGAARSIVIDENGRILAGNGTVTAAAEAGIDRVQVVDADGETIIAVRRTGLSEREKARLGILDNRTSELAEWDAQILAEIANDGVNLTDLWDGDDLEALIAEAAGAEVIGDPTGATIPNDSKLRDMGMHHTGAAVGLQCGDIMVVIDQELYGRLRDFVMRDEHLDRSAAMTCVISEGLNACLA